jgi:cation transport regulator ChaB
MPKDDKTKIPSTIQRSDKHAQEIWEKAHDSAVETYGEGGRAHRVAYAALKHQYEKKGDKWVRKAEKGPSDPQAARGPRTPRTSTAGLRASTARGKSATMEEEARRKSKEASKEYQQSRRR